MSAGSSAGAVGAAIHARRRRALIQRFQSLGATSSDKAADLKTLGIEKSRLFDLLLQKGVLHSAGQECFYLDEQAWERFESVRRTGAIVMCIVFAIAALVLILFVIR